jgi:hypothetical protein
MVRPSPGDGVSRTGLWRADSIAIRSSVSADPEQVAGDARCQRNRDLRRDFHLGRTVERREDLASHTLEIPCSPAHLPDREQWRDDPAPKRVRRGIRLLDWTHLLAMTASFGESTAGEATMVAKYLGHILIARDHIRAAPLIKIDGRLVTQPAIQRIRVLHPLAPRDLRQSHLTLPARDLSQRTRRLYLSQPGVSSQIRRLEQTIGADLCDRCGR